MGARVWCTCPTRRLSVAQELTSKALRRIAHKGVLRGWSAWHEAYLDTTHKRRLLASVGGRLARPRLYAAFRSWFSEWFKAESTSVEQAVTRLERMRRLEHGVVWEGVVAGAEGSSVVIAVDDGGAIAATVRIGRRLFSLTPRGGGVLAVEWDESAAPQDHASVTPRALAPSFRVPTRPEPAPDADAEVDVLVVYSAEAAHAAGSESALRATIELAVTEANRAFDESGVAGRVALAGFEPVEYDETGFDFERALRELSTPGDGQLDDVQELRDAYGADHVVFVIDHAGPYAGIGYQLTAGNASFFEPAAYAVVSRDYAAGHYTFAHELGHNFGANHDPAHASDGWRGSWREKCTPPARLRTAPLPQLWPVGRLGARLPRVTRFL